MKKLLLILFCLFLASPSWAGGVIMMGGGASGAATDSCTGALTFSWHMENADVTLGGVAGGVNNGCSVGDTVGTAVAGVGTASISTDYYEDGANAVKAERTAYYQFDVSSDDLMNHSVGTIDVWIYLHTDIDDCSIVNLELAVQDANNEIGLIVIAGKISLRHSAGGTARSVTSTLSLSADTWYHAIAKWDTVAHGGQYFSVCSDTTTGTGNCATTDFEQGTWAGTAAYLDIGNKHTLATFHTIYIDNLKIYNTWQ